MRTVWKYPIPNPGTDDTFDLQVPEYCRPLEINIQAGNPCLWAEVVPSQTEVRRFAWFATGQPVTHGAVHCGTLMFNLGVYHLYCLPGYV